MLVKYFYEKKKKNPGCLFRVPGLDSVLRDNGYEVTVLIPAVNKAAPQFLIFLRNKVYQSFTPRVRLYSM